MKNLLYFLLIILFFNSTSCKVELFDCTNGEGNIETRAVSIDSITGIEIVIGAKLVIKEGPIQEITIKAQSNIIDKIIQDSEINGETWEVNLDGCSETDDIELFVTLPIIKNAKVKGQAQIQSDGIFNNIDKLNLEIEGSGEIHFQMGNDVNKVDIEIDGQGDITLSGRTNEQSIDISGAGTINNFELQSDVTTLDISGEGNCNISVETTLFANLSGSGIVCYRGTPTLEVDISGAIDIRNCN